MRLLNEYCARIGGDSSMVQGAGGNVSWKDETTLAVKASGAWLADAEKKNIFVNVDLKALRAELAQGRFGAAPQVIDQSGLRPSIETVLHAIMPQKIVVHTHPIDALAFLVRADCREVLTKRLGKTVNWALVEYRKPGAELGAEVHRVVNQARDLPPEVVLLANHGVIVAADSLDEVAAIYERLGAKLAIKPRNFRFLRRPVSVPRMQELNYRLPEDEYIQRLAFDDVCQDIIKKHWALYPDHVVFLGAEPQAFETPEQFAAVCRQSGQSPDYAIIFQCGVFVRTDINQNKMSMLKCYGDVLARLDDARGIRSLSRTDTEQLLNWEAEKYRSRIAK